MSKQIKQIKFVDGSSYKIINRYAIYAYRYKYLKMDCVIYDGERIALPILDYCETCNRKFSEIRNNARYLCQSSKVNHKLEHVARVCIDCRWFYEYQKGIDPPPTIKRLFAEGFTPRLI